MPTPLIPSKVLSVIVAILALVAVLAYGVVGVISIVDVFRATSGPPVPGEPVTYVFTALSGLVGGIVAAAFGVSPPSRKLDGLANVSTGGLQAVQWIGLAYVLIYLIVGVGAIVAWMMCGDLTSDLVKNLAVVTIGMVIPIVAGYFAKATG